jgi:hypothetical protein
MIRAILVSMFIGSLSACSWLKRDDAPSSAAAAAPSSFTQFVQWLPGEYDNYEQFWLQTIELPEADRPADPHEHTHHVIVPVNAPKLGSHVYFVRQTLPQRDQALYRQRLYVVSEAARGATMEILAFREPEKWAESYKTADAFLGLKRSAMEAIPGCEVRWFFDGSGAFDGSVDGKTCRIRSEKLRQDVFVEDRWKLTNDQLSIREAARQANGELVYGRDAPHANRRVRYFEGWGAIKKEGKDAPRESKNWYGTRGIVVHSEGQYFPLKKDDGTPAGYSIQLARLTYQNTQQPILKFALIDDATGKSVAYSWAEIDATRIGINLGWIQAGLAVKKERPEWSW